MPHIADAEMARVFWTARAKKCERARGQDLLWKCENRSLRPNFRALFTVAQRLLPCILARGQGVGFS
jgi:hypothetical protein